MGDTLVIARQMRQLQHQQQSVRNYTASDCDDSHNREELHLEDTGDRTRHLDVERQYEYTTSGVGLHVGNGNDDSNDEASNATYDDNDSDGAGGWQDDDDDDEVSASPQVAEE